MTITFQCECGKILSCRDEDAGATGKCPHCGKRNRVPGQGPAGDEESFNQVQLKMARAEVWVLRHQRQIVRTVVGGGVLILALMAGYFLVLKDKLREWRTGPVVEAEEIRVDLDPDVDPSLWPENFSAFALAIQKAVDGNEDLAAKFVGQPIRWEVTFEALREGTLLYFYESHALSERNRAIIVWATLFPKEAEKLAGLKRGDRLILQGHLGTVTYGRSPANPLEEVRIGPVQCVVEEILPRAPRDAPQP